ncbi:hypothetical protein CALVIDRAFT_568263 [Calocera viscosa TUFC12733]|uniref:FAD/NAD(P)-binding domain-containing protein n=1 Tax=Calocera viscosa (strain TUFC12733) TaxID=1330018 RepID=A0A167FSF4_CALVF|nr:hypothetical protein CALVIDRAFT_569633 [Calocera viscosa TUFC12733]KZO91468.1 hypothetical protein CALVIDRAFT_568263 [Calocera viscosa TUFC12733]
MAYPLQESLRHAVQEYPNAVPVVVAAVSATMLYISWKAVQRAIINRFTALGDLENLGKPRSGRRLKGTTVIAGGSISGLLAARVASTHYEKVIVIESEQIVEDKPRTYVMQSLQLHTFLAFMIKALVKLYPDFTDQVRAGRGRVGYFIFPFWLGKYLRLDPETYDDVTCFVTRQSMENLIRRLTRERCANVEIWYKASVTGFETDNTRHIVSTQVRKGDGAVVNLDTALLLECSGPAVASRKWLSKNGFTPPVKKAYQPGVVYASAIFDMKKAWTINIDVIPTVGYLWGVRPAAGAARESGYVTRIEDNQILICAATWGGDEGLPRNVPELPDYFDRLPGWPEHRQLIRLLCETFSDTPLLIARPSPCHQIQWSSAVMPPNFAPIGDAVQKLNAQYGQGCCQSAMCVTTLDACVRREKGTAVSNDFSARYIKLLMGRITYLWDSSRLTDYGWSLTEPAPGESLKDGAFERYVQVRVIEAMSLDPKVTRHVYDGSAQACNHHLLEILNPRLLYWIIRLSLFGYPERGVPKYRLKPGASVKKQA